MSLRSGKLPFLAAKMSFFTIRGKPARRGRESAQNNPLAKTLLFRLHWLGFWGRVGLVKGTTFPLFTLDCTARHWRALLFLGFSISAEWQG
jgi:hypothetical protein